MWPCRHGRSRFQQEQPLLPSAPCPPCHLLGRPLRLFLPSALLTALRLVLSEPQLPVLLNPTDTSSPPPTRPLCDLLLWLLLSPDTLFLPPLFLSTQLPGPSLVIVLLPPRSVVFSEGGTVLSHRGHLTMSRDIFGHRGWVMGILGGGQGRRSAPYSERAAPHGKERPRPSASGAEAETPGPEVGLPYGSGLSPLPFLLPTACIPSPAFWNLQE